MLDRVQDRQALDPERQLRFVVLAVRVELDRRPGDRDSRVGVSGRVPYQILVVVRVAVYVTVSQLANIQLAEPDLLLCDRCFKSKNFRRL